MSVLLTKIFWYKVGDTDTSGVYSNPINITDSVSFNATRAIDVKNNIFSFKVKNRNEEFIEDGNIIFNQEDQIKVYAIYTDDGAVATSDAWNPVKSDEPSATYLVGTYYVVEYKEIHDTKNQFIEVKCADKTYVMFSKLVVISAKPSDNINAPEAIQLAVRRATENDKGLYSGTAPNAGVKYEVEANLEDAESGYITDLRRAVNVDGDVNADTTFPDINYASVWKPLYEVISELSQTGYTNTTTEQSSGVLVYGRPFIYWLDENNKFHWEYPDDNTDYTLVAGTNDIYRENLTRRVFDTVNMIIHSSGDDLNGVGIWDYYYDDSSDSRTLKMRFESYTDIVKNILEEDYAVNTTRNSTKKYDYPSSGSYPVTPSWLSTTVADDAEYNTALRVEAKKRGRVQAEKATKGLSKARWKGTIEVKGALYKAGELIDYTNSSQGITNVLLRITSVQHNFVKNGWFTTLNLEEDVDEIR